MNSNQEFFSLLEEIKEQELYPIQLTNRQPIKIKPLTALNLKDLVESVVDSPVTQSLFSSTINKIFKNSVSSETVIEYNSLNYIDKVIFAINTRILSLSSILKVTEETEQFEVDLNEIKNRLTNFVNHNPNVFRDQSVASDSCEITYGIPLLFIEDQINTEHNKNKTEKQTETPEQLRKVLGEAFINEIAKTIKSIKIKEKTIDLSAVPFKTRVQMIESLSASLLSDVIRFIETYKKMLDECLSVQKANGQNYMVNIDGSLFTMY
jgi:hypothetical protein